MTGPTGRPRGTGRALWGGGEVRSTAETGQLRRREGTSEFRASGCQGSQASPRSQASRCDSTPVVVNIVKETSGSQSADAFETPAANPRPLLAYDGDCGLCTYWARYWQTLTGDRVEYRPYQEVAVRYPAISQADFQRAVQFIAPDGDVASAAEASFLTLSHARGKGLWLVLYRNLPSFATISELAYAFIAAHRPGLF